MKFLKIVLFTCIFATIFASSIERVERKITKVQTQKKTTDEGSGSWEKGFVIPRIEFKLPEGTIVVRDNIFKPTQMLVGDNSHGFYLTNKNGVDQKLVQAGLVVLNKVTQTYYIPYRLFVSNANWQDPWFTNKYVQTHIRNDNGTKTCRLVFYFPYRVVRFWSEDFVNTDQLHTVVRNMNTRSQEIKKEINFLKTSIIETQSKYETNKELFNQMSKNATNKATAIANFEGQKAQNQKRIDELTKIIGDNNGKSDEMKQLLNKDDGEFNTADEDLKKLVEKLKATQDLEKSIEANKGSKDNLKKSIEGDVNLKLLKLNEPFQDLEKAIPSQLQTLAAAKNTILKSDENYKKELNKITVNL